MARTTVVVPPPIEHDFNQVPQQTKGSAISYANREVLERAKIELATRPDFNLIDAFRVFDTNGSGSITN